MRTPYLSLLISATCLFAGCRPPAPPAELTSARDAWARAKDGPAKELAPANLEDARQALDAAEKSFDKNKDKPVTRDLAYIAERKVAIAESEAAQMELKREKRDTDAALTAATQGALVRTEAELAKQRAESAKTKEQLEAERAARLATEKKLSAALRSLDEIAAVKEESRGVVITLSGAVLFASGKYTLLALAQSKLDEVAKALKDQGYQRIVVEGHTDSRGSDDANLSLSQKRAEAVRTYLVSQGIDSNKISAAGIGEARPVADNNTAEGRANNRRVELVVTPE